MKNSLRKNRVPARRESLAGRLVAYSVMAGAALSVMPSADGAIVSPSKNGISWAPSFVCETALIQSHQMQSQKFRHARHAGMHVMSTSTCTPTPTPTTAE